ncbi:GNAT family N-acetyltransferase [Methanofollis tationis]|uniref:GNAT family N-acetyltransferase n=1 Tax=Methanofollis tationis TaxID=81417 RepID=A0A7K4HNU5_9EURY|nr:GNAT family N-acetyltransferase [Methanofollis tationis]NVO66956.1 GNAT family N-acetyltransferase [Methanofollis tationis]
MQVAWDDQISKKRWTSIVGSSEHTYFFHTPEWAEILQGTFGHRIATRLYEVDGIEVLIPMVEKRTAPFRAYASMPHGYGGVFGAENLSPGALSRIFRSMVGGRSVGFTLHLPPGATIPVNGDRMIRRCRNAWTSAHLLSLDRPCEDLHAGVHREIRRQVRTGERRSVVVEHPDGIEGYRSYYSLYEQRSKEWGYRVPEYPWTLFEHLCRCGAPHVRLRIAEREGTPVGGLITFEYGDTVFCWGLAVPMASRHLYPTHLMFFDLIEDACERGFSCINFGASGPLAGVRNFKERFGAREIPTEDYCVLSGIGDLWWHLRGYPLSPFL